MVHGPPTTVSLTAALIPNAGTRFDNVKPLSANLIQDTHFKGEPLLALQNARGVCHGYTNVNTARRSRLSRAATLTGDLHASTVSYYIARC